MYSDPDSLPVFSGRDKVSTKLGSRWVGLVVLLANFFPCSAAAELSCSDEAADVGEWVRLTPTQSPDSAVLEEIAKDRLPSRSNCAEATFTGAGLDGVVTESQWSLILQAVVGSTGMVERFRIVYRPKLSIDFEGPVAKALSEWRFEPFLFDGKMVPLCIIFAIAKPMGSGSSDACTERPETEAEPAEPGQ